MHSVSSMYTYVGAVVVNIYFMSVLDVLMCGGGLYLFSGYSMCAYVGGCCLYLISVYSMYAYVCGGWWSISSLCIHMCWGVFLHLLFVYSLYLYTHVGGSGGGDL